MALTFKNKKNYAKISKSCCFKSKKKENPEINQRLFRCQKERVDRCQEYVGERSDLRVPINAAARLEGMSYSQLMGALHKAGIEINRKVLADLAMNHPEAFKAIVAKVKA